MGGIKQMEGGKEKQTKREKNKAIGTREKAN